MGGGLFSTEDEKADQEEEHEKDAEGGSEGLVACAGELILDDLADGGVGATAHEGGDGVHGDGGNKYEKSASGDAGLGERDDDARKCAEGACPEVVGSFHEGVIEFFDTGVDGENHKREIVVNEAEDDGEGGVHHGEGSGQNVGREKEAIDESFLAEDGNPGVGADEETSPERNHHESKQEAAIGGAGATDGVGGGVADNDADHSGEKGVEDRVPENGKPSGIEASAVVVEGEGVDDATELVTTTEAGEDEEKGGQKNKEPEPEDEGTEEEPGFPARATGVETGSGWGLRGGLCQGGLVSFGFNLGDEFIDLGAELAKISEGLHPGDVLRGRVAGGVG